MHKINLSIIAMIITFLLAGSAVAISYGFEKGINPWTFYTNGIGNVTQTQIDKTEGNSSAMIKLTTVGDNTQFYILAALEPSTKYRLIFSAKSSDGDDFDIFIHKHGSPYNTYGLSITNINITTEWKTFYIEFTTTGFTTPVTDARIRFWLSTDAINETTYFIDNVILVKVAAPLCTPNAKQCVGNAFQVCNSAGSAWSTQTTCPSGQTCSNGICSIIPAPICVAGTLTCNNATSTKKCNVDEATYTITSCGVGQTCNNGLCTGISPECTIANQATTCNDNNVNTLDKCVNSKCSHTPITTQKSPLSNKLIAAALIFLSIIGLIIYYLRPKKK